MLSFDVSLIVQIIEALLLAIILNYLLLKPVTRIFEERKERFMGLENEISRYEKMAGSLVEKYNQTLQEARMEGLKKQELLKEEARRLERETLQRVMKEIEEKKKTWEESFKLELKKVREELLAQKEAIAEIIIEKLVGRKA